MHYRAIDIDAPALVGQPAPMHDTALYEEIRKAGLQRHVLQWQSFATFCQYRRAFETTRRDLRPGAVALDWGCGNGHFSFFLVRHAIRTVALSVDRPPPYLSPEELFEARRGDPGEPLQHPFTAAPYHPC